MHNTPTQKASLNSTLIPWRAGYCDAIMGRPCASPWSHHGWSGLIHDAKYVNGYLEGEAIRKKLKVIPIRAAA